MKYSDNQIKKLLNNLVIIIDTREQENKHIIKSLEKNNKRYILKKLDQGDYGAYIEANTETIPLGIIEDYYIEDIAIERKGSVNELIGNFVERERIENEFIRFKENNIKLFLMVEDPDGFEKILRGQFRSRMSRKAAKATYFTFVNRYDISSIFLEKELSALFVHDTLYYYVREKLKGGL